MQHLITHTLPDQVRKVFWNEFWQPCWNPSRSQRPRGPRLVFATAHLLRLWVRILPGEWMSLLCFVSCLEKVSASGWSLVQRNATECDVSDSVFASLLEGRGFEILCKRKHHLLNNNVWCVTNSVLVFILKSSLIYGLWTRNFSIFYRGPTRLMRTLASMSAPTAVKLLCVQLL